DASVRVESAPAPVTAVELKPDPARTLKGWCGILTGLGGAGLITAGTLFGLTTAQGKQLVRDIAIYNANPKRSQDTYDKLVSRTQALSGANVITLVVGG